MVESIRMNQLEDRAGCRGLDTCDDWLNQLLLRMFQLLHTIVKDNFDSERYRDVAPTTFFYDQHATYFSFFVKSAPTFFQARCLLSDDTSKSLFDQLILFRILSHLHVRLPFNTPEAREYRSVTETWRV